MRTLYMVMKLHEEVSFKAPSGAEVDSGPIANLAGFVPVYHTSEEAEEASKNGLFQILAIEIPE